MSPAHPSTPTTDFADGGAACHRHGSLIWVPLRSRWVDVTRAPEEVVRQEWIRRLVIDGGFDLNQMDQEKRTQHGHGSPRADIVVWESASAMGSGAAALMVVETKAADGPVIESDFRQGASYAVAGGAGFLVAATASAHAVYEMTPGFPGRATQINDWPTAADFADSRKLDALRRSLREFDRDEFQKLLAECHDLLRDHHAMTPDNAFDTISKILFIKLSSERRGSHQTFTTDWVDRFNSTRLDTNRSVHEDLFQQTKAAYKADDLFAEGDRLDISDATFRAIVSKLERFNLSKTGEDIKGIAFEQFLGRTFRGELGQFFTPRPVVNFMVDALDPQEGELVCDPAAGSGGFLIRCFDHIRAVIAADIEAQKTEVFDEIRAEYPDDASEEQLFERDQRIDEAFEGLNEALIPTEGDGSAADTRVGRLAWSSIYGTDKEPRAARTAKMNMIMHGDGHGGIHAHDGLVNINGIWDGRFDVIVTNPPFGATVTTEQLIGGTRETDVPTSREYARAQTERYGDAWKPGHNDVIRAKGSPILETLEIGKGKKSRQTEVLFVERVLRLLKPGGRAAIILPNGNLNATSLGWLRRWAESKAYVRGVVALPMETFKFSKASVSASIVFLDRYTDEDTARWDSTWRDVRADVGPAFQQQRQDVVGAYQERIVTAEGSQELIRILGELAPLGVTRVLPDFVVKPNPDLVENAGKTSIGAPKWDGRATGRAAELKREYLATAAEHSDSIGDLMKELRATLRAVDDEETASLWAEARKRLDYPVFMARPGSVGITATGDTGAHVPNDLESILSEYRRFRSWLTDGAAEGGF